MITLKHKRNTLLLILVFIFQVCFICCRPGKFDKNKYGNCSDGIQNQNEEGVDCGGHCLPCANCNDGEKNAGETGIDCGGSCINCVPACSTPSATIIYTLHPQDFPSGIFDQNTSSYDYFDKNSSSLTIDFNGSGVMDEFNIFFMPGFNPFNYIPLNETMVFTTFKDDPFASITNKSQIKASFRAYLGFNYYTRSILPGQPIHFTKISDTQIMVRFCNISGAENSTLSMNVTVN